MLVDDRVVHEQDDVFVGCVSGRSQVPQRMVNEVLKHDTADTAFQHLGCDHLILTDGSDERE